MHNLGLEARRVVNLVAPESLRPLPSEYSRLSAALMPHVVGNMKNLAAAQENAERQDLTRLNRATGWDARLIAFAANAAILSNDPAVGLSQEVLYGLLRTGLPTDKFQLAQVDNETIAQALSKVVAANIIDLTAQQMTAAKAQFTTFARETRMVTPTLGSHATYKDVLQASGLSSDAQAKFADVYVEHRGDNGALWEKARAAGIADNDIQRLQLQGKLAYLTQNNVELMVRLQQGLGITDVGQLVDRDFHRAETWTAEIKALAGSDEQKLQRLVPPIYGGEKVQDRLTLYAEDLARKIRLSYPTPVVARLIELDSQDNMKFGSGRTDVASVLKKAVTHGFTLSQSQIDAFLDDHPDILTGLSAERANAATQGLKALKRVYQMTPSDEAMLVLLNLGLTSASQITAMTRDTFLQRYAARFPMREQAELVYDKATQVDAVIQNMFTVIRRADSEPQVRSLARSLDSRALAQSEIIKRFPVMESLFGSLDYCECEHCRSVLSPAAYLVDLLQFINKDDVAWKEILTHWKTTHSNAAYPFANQSDANIFYTDWKNKHNNASYPFKNPAEWNDFLKDWKNEHPGQADPDPEMRLRPYDVLIQRRPDLPHIALTCENTNTALPYIDVVNEILEYYVANGQLTDAAARDTDDASSAALLAEPQNVIREAYDKLATVRYPLTLPFDLWLATVRRFCQYFETPLWRVLDVLRPSDELINDPKSYDRMAVFIESLGLSPAEYAIFTDPDPLKSWHTLYGYNSAAEATTITTDPTTKQRIDLNSAKALSRRLGVTYKELVELVQTDFVSPQSSLRLLAEDGELTSDFDKVTLVYADGRAADGMVFLRINLFVRLWRALGWTMGELDRALQTFMPKNTPFDQTHLSSVPLRTVLLYLAHLNTLSEQVQVGKQARLKLLTLWSSEPPTSLFAKALGISVAELAALQELSGLNPFMPLSVDVVRTQADDHFLTHTLRFVEVVEQIKQSGLSIVDLDYLLRHHFDPVGKYRLQPETTLTLLKTVSQGIRSL